MSGPKFLKFDGMPDEDTNQRPPTTDQSVDYADELVDEDGDKYELYQSIYKYKSQDADDLNFEAGEIIRVTDAGTLFRRSPKPIC